MKKFEKDLEHRNQDLIKDVASQLAAQKAITEVLQNSVYNSGTEVAQGLSNMKKSQEVYREQNAKSIEEWKT